MRPMRRGLLLVALLAACDRADTPSAPPTAREEQTRTYIRAMKAMQLQVENLQADLAARKPSEEAGRRIAAIKADAEQAARLNIRASDAENRDLAFEFAKFLDTVAKLEGTTWSGEPGMAAYKRLGAACASCHNLYREDR
jgi:cytochrome c556